MCTIQILRKSSQLWKINAARERFSILSIMYVKDALFFGALHVHIGGSTPWIAHYTAPIEACLFP